MVQQAIKEAGTVQANAARNRSEKAARGSKRLSYATFASPHFSLCDICWACILF